MIIRRVGVAGCGLPGTGYPMGPFTPLERMVPAGYHGRKSGTGFHDCSQDPPRPTEGLI